MDNDVAPLLGELRQGLQDLYGPRLRGLYLFGSRARGDAEPDSDVDVLIVLDEFNDSYAELTRVSGLNGTVSRKYDMSVSLVFVQEHDWAEGKTPFLCNVRDEAVAA